MLEMFKKCKKLLLPMVLVLLFSCDNSMSNRSIETKSQTPELLQTLLDETMVNVPNHSKSLLGNLQMALSEDIVLKVIGVKEIPFSGEYLGVNQTFKYFIKFLAKIKIQEITHLFTLSGENSISSHFQIKGKVRRTGKVFDLEFIYYYDLDSVSQVQSLDIYYNTYLFWEAFQKNSSVPSVDLESGNVDFNSEYQNGQDVMDELFSYWLVGDLDGVLSMFNDDIIWIMRNDPLVVPYAGRVEGKDGFVNEYLIPLISNVEVIDSGFTHVVVHGNRADYYLYEENRCIPTGKESKIVGVMSYVIDTNSGKISECIVTYESFAVRDTFIVP